MDENDKYKDPTIRTLFLDGTMTAPIDVDFQIRARGLLPLIFSLTQYELEVYSFLLAIEKPLKARQIGFQTKIPRSKIYGVLKRLREAGLVQMSMLDIDKEKLPDVWEFWTPKRQQYYISSKQVGIQRFEANTDMLEEKVKAMVSRADMLKKFIEEVKEREIRLQNR